MRSAVEKSLTAFWAPLLFSGIKRRALDLRQTIARLWGFLEDAEKVDAQVVRISLGL
jgi:hypothetical protein